MRFLFAIGLAGAGLAVVPATRAGTVDWIEALVGDAIITGWQVQEPTYKFMDSLRQHDPNESRSFYQTKIDSYQQETLKSMVNVQLVLQDFKRLEKENHAKIPDIWVDEKVRDEIHDRYQGDRSLLIKDLQAEGMTMEQFRAQARDGIIVSAMQSQFLTDPIISPHKMEEYYRDHQDKYKVEERVRLQRLFLKKPADDTTGKTRERAQDILLLYKPGTPFADLVKSYSDSPPDDGEWREVPALGQAFQDELKKLKPGQCSGVVETPEGCFLLFLVERDAQHTAPLSEVRDQVEKELTAEEKSRRFDNWIKRLRAKTFVQEF
jgi:peptidyl-prolyl cis-trans isomerase SurA